MEVEVIKKKEAEDIMTKAKFHKTDPGGCWYITPLKNTRYRSYFIDPVHSQVLGSNMNMKIA